jgi:NAD-dependent deacetylase
MRRLILISGAGLSVESGIRAFRTDTDSGKAMWDEYDLEEVCNIHAFRGNFYHKTHNFYNKRRVELGTVEPNLAHCRIAEWSKAYAGQVVNITTNVDDLLERAGVFGEVLHVHGFLPEIIVQDEPLQVKRVENVGYNEINPDDYEWCKPNVVFFGENAPLYGEMYSILDSLTVQDLVIVVGCSNQVINFFWDLIPKARSLGIKIHCVNPGTLYHEEQIIEEVGGTCWRAGAVEVFSNPKFIEIVEKHLEG